VEAGIPLGLRRAGGVLLDPERADGLGDGHPDGLVPALLDVLVGDDLVLRLAEARCSGSGSLKRAGRPSSARLKPDWLLEVCGRCRCLHDAPAFGDCVTGAPTVNFREELT